MIVPELTDGVVTLRAHRAADAEDMTAMGRDPESARWTSMPQPYERRHAEEYIARAPGRWRDGTAYPWAVTVDGRFAGNLDVRGTGVPDIGYALAPWARGRGAMARAVRLATRWAFDQGLAVVHWSTHAGNLASWRVAHACGFTFHGERPLSLPHRGELRDGWFASLRPGDAPTPRTTWWPVPVLQGRSVRLRAHTDADVPRIAAACADPRSRHWLVNLPRPYTEDDARAFVRRCRLGESLGRSVTWAVADPVDDRLLANVGVFDLAEPLNPTGGEIGYWAHPDARGRGVVGEAVDLVVAHAFAADGLGRHRLLIETAWDNAASRHVAERAGFTLVGQHRQDGKLGDGTLVDGAWYDRLATD